MAADLLYLSQPVPAAAASGPQPAQCCASSSSVGAAGAQTPQDWRPEDAGGGAPVVMGTKCPSSGRRSCKCWWVALAAVVVIALVARTP
jgi:hypothetical protein